MLLKSLHSIILIFLMFGFAIPVSAMSPCEAYLEITKTKVIWMIQPLHAFDSAEELQKFLGDYNGNLTLIAEIKILHKDIDCDEFAFKLRNYARSKGYDMETEIFCRGDWYINHKLRKDHFACKVFIGNWIYIVDPVNKKIWRLCRID